MALIVVAPEVVLAVVTLTGELAVVVGGADLVVTELAVAVVVVVAAHPCPQLAPMAVLLTELAVCVIRGAGRRLVVQLAALKPAPRNHALDTVGVGVFHRAGALAGMTSRARPKSGALVQVAGT